MREIKFRAWDTERNLMIGSDYPDNWGTDKDEWYADVNQMDLVGIQNISTSPRFHVMQFIGLKDNYGKEIYESDICSAFGTTILIEWHNGSFGYWSSKGEPFAEFHSIATHRYLSEIEGSIHNIEVIGNVYENPKLP